MLQPHIHLQVSGQKPRVKLKESTSKYNGPVAFPMALELSQLHPSVKGLFRCPPGQAFCPAVLELLICQAVEAEWKREGVSCSHQIPSSPCSSGPQKARKRVCALPTSFLLPQNLLPQN